MMRNLDFSTKEIVKSYVYSSISEDRMSSKPVQIDGRWYEKYGVEQAVTFVGVIYKLINNETNMYETVLHVGLSKQHPNDAHIDKHMAYEVAQENAFMCPFWTMKINDKFNYYNFRNMMQEYLSHMDLKFIKTRLEKEKEAKKA